MSAILDNSKPSLDVIITSSRGRGNPEMTKTPPNPKEDMRLSTKKRIRIVRTYTEGINLLEALLISDHDFFSKEGFRNRYCPAILSCRLTQMPGNCGTQVLYSFGFGLTRSDHEKYGPELTKFWFNALKQNAKVNNTGLYIMQFHGDSRGYCYLAETKQFFLANGAYEDSIWTNPNTGNTIYNVFYPVTKKYKRV